jgi:hypothetical protein
MYFVLNAIKLPSPLLLRRNISRYTLSSVCGRQSVMSTPGPYQWGTLTSFEYVRHVRSQQRLHVWNEVGGIAQINARVLLFKGNRQVSNAHSRLILTKPGPYR